MDEIGSQAYLAFAAGLLSVLSPCVLPLLPAYLSLISGITVEEMQEGDVVDQLVKEYEWTLGALRGVGF